MTSLSEAIGRGDDKDLAEVVSALIAIKIGVEDIFRILLGCQLLEQLSNDQNAFNQRKEIVKSVSKVLGVPEMNCEASSLASLANFLRLRMLQSIVKKVNRTLARRAALRILCNNKTSKSRNQSKVVLVDCPFPLPNDQDATNIMMINPRPLPREIQELFRPDHCSFGFASHLFSSLDSSDSSISATSSLSSSPSSSDASSVIFCLDPDIEIVRQVRDLDILEHLMDQSDQLWQRVSLEQFYKSYRSVSSHQSSDIDCSYQLQQHSYFHLLIRMLFLSDPDRDAPEDDLIVRLIRMIDHQDGLELNEVTNPEMVMVRLDTRRRMETVIIR